MFGAWLASCARKVASRCDLEDRAMASAHASSMARQVRAVLQELRQGMMVEMSLQAWRELAGNPSDGLGEGVHAGALSIPAAVPPEEGRPLHRRRHLLGLRGDPCRATATSARTESSTVTS